jgi:hypothetical protein
VAATATAVKAAVPAVAERAQGLQPSRARALLAAVMVAAAAGFATYKVLRSVPSGDGDALE